MPNFDSICIIVMLSFDLRGILNKRVEKMDEAYYAHLESVTERTAELLVRCKSNCDDLNINLMKLQRNVDELSWLRTYVKQKQQELLAK